MATPEKQSAAPSRLNVPTPGAFPSSSPTQSPVMVSPTNTQAQALNAVRFMFVEQKEVKIKIGTWNVGAAAGAEKDIRNWFVEEQQTSGQEQKPSSSSGQQGESGQAKEDGEEIGIYALGLQEIVEVSLGLDYLRSFSDTAPAQKWKRVMEDSLPEGYVHVAEQQLVGMLLLIFASPKVAPQISHISTTYLGTGMLGYGNKGAVAARIVLGEATRLVFINCHLAAGAEPWNLEKRNSDASHLMSTLSFDPYFDGSDAMTSEREKLGKEDIAFFFGDLNYRLDGMPGADARRLLDLHISGKYSSSDRRPSSDTSRDFQDALSENQPKEGNPDFGLISPNSSDTIFDVSEPPLDPAEPFHPGDIWSNDPSMDPTSLLATLASLLRHDQLRSQIKERKAMYQGWREGSIQFLPTYKYDVGSEYLFDTSDKQRAPAFCDRIFYRTKKDVTIAEEEGLAIAKMQRRQASLANQTDQTPAAGVPEYEEYDPERDGEGGEENTQWLIDEGYVPPERESKCALTLLSYASAQSVVTSDHKPLSAAFSVAFEAVNAPRRASIAASIARELDKAENAARPQVTIVAEERGGGSSEQQQQLAVDFGAVGKGEEVSRQVSVANTGVAEAVVGLVKRGGEGVGEGRVVPEWVEVAFVGEGEGQGKGMKGGRWCLQPGDCVAILLTVRFPKGKGEGEEGEEGGWRWEDVLVIGVDGGRHHFVSLGGWWVW